MKMLTTLAAIVAFAPMAMAQNADFVAADINADGQLTTGEVMAFHPDATQELFAQADIDASGTLSEAEYASSALAQ